MRSLLFLTLVVETCYAAIKCGTGSVDLSGAPLFSVSINCPANKDRSGVAMGCVTEKKAGLYDKMQSQKSNVFVVNPCATFDAKEPTITECSGELTNFPTSNVMEITKDINDDKSIDTECYSVGSPTQMTFTLLDKDNPDEGVRAIYPGGSDKGCPFVTDKDGKLVRKKRSFEVNYHCSLQSNDMYNDVEEPDQSRCTYVMHFNTIHACPNYCVTGNKICNGNGICGHGSEPCLCDTGYTGKYCEIPGYPPLSSAPQGFTVAAALLTVGILLLAALLAFLLYMWIKLRRLAPVDTEAYSTLTSKFNELGQIT